MEDGVRVGKWNGGWSEGGRVKWGVGVRVEKRKRGWSEGGRVEWRLE